MKIKRQKTAKRVLGFYQHNLGFRQPHQLLLDGTFCQAALLHKIQIKEQMPKYLMAEVQLCTTGCVLKELESLGEEVYGAKLIAQRFQVRSCPHFKNPVAASVCLLSMVQNNNPHHYFVATQDHQLTMKIKKLPGVPLLYIIQNTIVLEKPSPKSIAHIQAQYSNQFVTATQKVNIQQLKTEQGLAKEHESRSRKRKRKGGPNPLSCLKKKKIQITKEMSKEKKKLSRSRRRKKVTAKSGSHNVEAH
uniref:rRNA-processing protein UTP23 homolog n=1 Tax=Callorhinchus milii TaxID=7868 RepID=V9L1Y3_CALMI